MSGLLSPKRSQLANNILGGIRLQTSQKGIVIPYLKGRNRIVPNVLFYGFFVADVISNKSGKGGLFGAGGKGQQNYDYGAAVQMALGWGIVSAILNTWDTQGVLAVNNTSETYTVADGGGNYTVSQTDTYIADLGCTYASEYSVSADDFGSPGPVTLSGTQQIPMQEVPGTPGAGQYNQSDDGKYTFSAADAGKVVTVNYSFGPPDNTTNPDPITSLNFELSSGEQGQAPWAYLVGALPSASRGYTMLAHLDSERLDLGSSGALPNLSFEAQADMAYGDGSGDCVPDGFIFDIMTNVLFPRPIATASVDSLATYRNYCIANGILFSPFLTEQRTKRDWIADFLEASNSEMVQSGALLRIVPYGDTTVVGNGATYTPPAPIYDLDDDDFMLVGDAKPVGAARPGVQQAPNSVRVNFSNRASSYNDDPVQADMDLWIQKYGLIPDAQRDFKFIAQQTVAAVAAQQILQRKTMIRNTFKIQTDFRYCLLDPMDLITLTDPRLGFDMKPARIKSVTEMENHALQFELEDFPWGAAGATLYPKQGGSPGGPNANQDPGPLGNVAILEANTAMRGADPSQELWVFVAGANPAAWGGCVCWLSIDGGNTYPSNLAGVLKANSTLGTLYADYPSHADPDSTDDLKVLFAPGASMRAFSTAEQANLASLSIIGPAGGGTAYRLPSYELVAFGNASIIGTVSGQNEWDLLPSGGSPLIRRGLKGSAPMDHPVGSTFALLDGNMLVFELDPSLAGKTLYFKFTGFNKQGNMQQSIADATPYTFAPTGLQPGLYNFGYSIDWDNPADQLAQSGGGTAITVSPFTIVGSGGSPHYLGTSTQLTGLSNTALYNVYVYDPNFQGENAALGITATYVVDTDGSHGTMPGYYYLGQIQMVSGGTGTGTGGGGQDGPAGPGSTLPLDD